MAKYYTGACATVKQNCGLFEHPNSVDPKYEGLGSGRTIEEEDGGRKRNLSLSYNFLQFIAPPRARTGER